MKTLLFLLFINCLCIAQPRINRLADIPTADKDECMRYGKLMLSRLKTPPDTLNNEWEKYTLRYVDLTQHGFYADNPWLKFEAEPWYFDVTTYNKLPCFNFFDVIISSSYENSSNIEAWSYDGKYQLMPEDIVKIFNIFETYEVYDSLRHILPDYTGVDVEVDDDFFVIEKTIRTKKHQIIHQLLALAPRYTIHDRNTGDPRGRKLLGWFVIK